MVAFQLVFPGVRMIGLAVEGHAPTRDGLGGNIVCAAVSTVCDMAVRGCSLYDADLECDAGCGAIKFVCRRLPETEAIIKSAMIELQEIKKHYPDCFMKG